MHLHQAQGPSQFTLPTVDLEILTVAVHPRIGGMTTWIDSLAHGFAALGWSVRLVGISDEWSEHYNDAPFQALHVPMAAPAGGLLNPIDKWRRWREVRHSLLRWNRGHPSPRLRLSDSTPGILKTAKALTNQDQVPWIVLAGGNVFDETSGYFWSPLMHRSIRANMGSAERVFVDGPDLRLSLASHGIPPEKIEVQYHGVDISTFGTGKGSNTFFKQDDSGMKLVWHGRLTDTGGPLRFLSIASQVPDCSVRMCGEGPQREEVLNQLSRLGHPEWYVGQLTRLGVASLLGEAEIGIYPLRSMAGIPRVLLESMASGLVTLTWDTGACRELITDTRDGFICRDETAMLEILGKLRNAPELVRGIGSEARETVKKSWTEEATLQAFARKLEGLMAR